MRNLITTCMVNLPQAQDWILILFNGSEDAFLDFVHNHSKDGTWTDDLGVMVTAAALVLGHPLHLYGTANIGLPGEGFTEIDSPGFKIPFTLGYYQGEHYISLVRTDSLVIPEITITGSFQEDLPSSTPIPLEKKKPKKEMCLGCGRGPFVRIKQHKCKGRK